MQGATSRGVKAIPLAWFQSTPLCKGRLNEEIEIKLAGLGFNPRPCARGDSVVCSTAKSLELFQSTPLCKGRRDLGMTKSDLGSFNPRPCARGDGHWPDQLHHRKSFNPRPCARGDKILHPAREDLRCFNPRPCARGDLTHCA